ncbi:MAG: antitoxin VapB family protein [Nitrososphaerales archaeon]
MATKNISITEEAYSALQREKRHNESFTETILRLTEKSGKLADCYSSWNMNEQEEAKIKSDLSKGWKRATERLVREVH